MTATEKIKAYFKERKMSNRDISKAMNGYSESMISRYLNADVLSKTFIENINKYFPEIDLNYVLKDDEELNLAKETKEEYKAQNKILIEEIEERLRQLAKNLSQM